MTPGWPRGRPESSAPVDLDWEVGVFVWISSNRSGILDFLEENEVYNIEGSHQGQSNTLAFVPVPVLSPLARQPGVEWAFMMFPPEPAGEYGAALGADLDAGANPAGKPGTGQLRPYPHAAPYP